MSKKKLTKSKLRKLVREEIQNVIREDIGNSLLADELREEGLSPESVEDVYVTTLQTNLMPLKRKLERIAPRLSAESEAFITAMEDIIRDSDSDLRDYKELDDIIQQDIPSGMKRSTPALLNDAARDLDKAFKKLEKAMSALEAFR